MDTTEAIRQRRSVRRYTDRPVPDSDLDELLRLALLAPTGGMTQAWSLVVVRDPEVRSRLAELVIDGAGDYFAMARPAARGATPEQHAEWARGYARQTLETYRHVPVWIAGLRVPRNAYRLDDGAFERDADVLSVGFMMENLFVAARAKGLGTVPTTFHWFREEEIRRLLALPPELEVPVLTPLGYPEEFPTSLPPALKRIKRPWRTLVHDDRWGHPRA